VRKHRSFGCATILALAAAQTASAEDGFPWPQWGGPGRDFRASEAALATRWPAGGPKKIWSRALGEGYSSIVVDSDALYTMYRVGDDEIVVSLDASTGETRWEHRYEASLREHMDYGTWLRQGGAGPYATPLLLGDAVYAVGTTGRLHALDRKTGKILWYHDLDRKFQMSGYHGFAPSPMVTRGPSCFRSAAGAGCRCLRSGDRGRGVEEPGLPARARLAHLIDF
jgi:hypothetical protein